MFDDLRQQSAAPTEEEDEMLHESLIERMPIFKQLTPQQRFFIALLLLFNVVVLGCGCLLASGRVVP
ncbi:MAG TPA: hypothetical protein VFF70_02375 [Anaerolineae bacterium]|jgi:hypothetical protein|nr:hypothetical protein [Anaerolineae bacterium]